MSHGYTNTKTVYTLWGSQPGGLPYKETELFKSSDQNEFYDKVTKVKEAGVFKFLRTTVTQYHASDETIKAREEFRARGRKAVKFSVIDTFKKWIS